MIALIGFLHTFRKEKGKSSATAITLQCMWDGELDTMLPLWRTKDQIPNQTQIHIFFSFQQSPLTYFSPQIACFRTMEYIMSSLSFLLVTSQLVNNVPTVFIFFWICTTSRKCVQIYFFPASARAQTVINIMYERKKKKFPIIPRENRSVFKM